MGDVRNWSTKTLAKQLIHFLNEQDYQLSSISPISQLLDALKSAVVEEEVGESLEWDSGSD